MEGLDEALGASTEGDTYRWGLTRGQTPGQTPFSSSTTRRRISSRIFRTSSRLRPFGSSSGQSSRVRPGTYGHSSPHPIVISMSASDANFVVSL